MITPEEQTVSNLSPERSMHGILVIRCVVLRGDGRFLILRRSGQNNHSAGLWELPGGKVDPQESAFQAGSREVKEETGLIVEESGAFFLSEGRVITDKDNYGVAYVALSSVARLGQNNSEVILSLEHDRSAWVSYSDITDYDFKPGTVETLQQLGSFLFQK